MSRLLPPTWERLDCRHCTSSFVCRTVSEGRHGGSWLYSHLLPARHASLAGQTEPSDVDHHCLNWAVQCCQNHFKFFCLYCKINLGIFAFVKAEIYAHRACERRRRRRSTRRSARRNFRRRLKNSARALQVW